MSPAGKLAGFAVVLGAVLGGGAAVGSAVGPIDVGSDDTPEHGAHDAGSEAGGAEAGGAETTAATGEATLPGGLLVSQAGYTFVPDVTVLDGVAGAQFRFRITGPDGAAVSDFEIDHERELHLIVVSRDLTTYAHLHPTRGPDGTWSVPLPALAPGAYRAFADFAIAGGPELTLGVDLTVPGPTGSTALPLPATTADAGDGYRAALTFEPVAGSDTEVELTVDRNGLPVDDLEPYLGADGHLVAIRAGDLAYLHVHPVEDAEPEAAGNGDGSGVRFTVAVPSPGDYRLFFDFAHDGVVRTAAFTVPVPALDAAGGSAPTESHGSHDTAEEES